MVVGLLEIDGAGDLGVHGGAAQLFGGIFLADGGFDERGAGEEEAAALGHEDVVGHDGQIGAAGDAHAHDGGDLRDAHGGHARVVAEDAAEVVLIGEDVFLQRQEDAGGVDEIERGDVVLHRDVLRAENLLGGHGKEGAGLYGGVVGDDHAEASGDAAKSADDAGGGRAAPFVIHVKRRERTQLEEIGVGIEKERDALARGEALLGVLRLDGFRAAALADGGFLLAERGEEREHAGGVGLLTFRFGVELRGDGGVERGRLYRGRRVVWAGHGRLASISACPVAEPDGWLQDHFPEGVEAVIACASPILYSDTSSPLSMASRSPNSLSAKLCRLTATPDD